MSNPRHSPLEVWNLLYAELKESFLMAMNALAAHKLRSALTLLGVLVGVFSIIIVMTAMHAMQKRIQADLDTLGGETSVVSKWPQVFFGGRGGFEKFWRRKELTTAQARYVQERASLLPNIGQEADFSVNEIKSEYGEAPPGTDIMGETPGSFPARNWVVAEGRGLLDADVDGAHDVCVLGSALATNLFPHGSALDQHVRFDSINYAVVGVLEPKGAMAGGNQDNFAVIPISTGLSRYGWKGQSIRILVESGHGAQHDDTMEQARSILRVARKVPLNSDDDFEIATADSMMAQIDSFTFAVRLGVALISSISLLAAGIGIMNIMLVSVTERTREIGIRRAVGAKKRNIMAQFILEAVILCEVGGAIGVVFGILGGNVAGHFLNLPVVIPYDWVAIGLIICSAVGIVFGTYPAYKAANLDPIESLRYE